MNATVEDHYAYLGISPTATRAEIDAAYRSRMRAVHPDAAATDPTDAQRRHLASVRLNEIVGTLRDPAKRAAYDRELDYSIRHRNDPPGHADEARLWQEPSPRRTEPPPRPPKSAQGDRAEWRRPPSRRCRRSVRDAWRAFSQTRTRRASASLGIAVCGWLLASTGGQWLLLGMLVAVADQPIFQHLTGTTSAPAAFVNGFVAWTVAIAAYTRAIPEPIAFVVSLAVDLTIRLDRR